MREKLRDVRSFSLVSTHPCERETALLIFSIRRAGYQCPILLVCDDIVANYLRQFKFPNIIIKREANTHQLENAKVEEKNTFHRPQIIMKKMDAMQWAIDECDNTMFVDSDLLFLRDFDYEINYPNMLSPHYGTQESADRYGGFNAGYLFSEDPTLPERWRWLYLNRSRFYEQECMAILTENYDCGKFSKQHNIGIWRSGFHRDLTISIHQHFDTATYSHAFQQLKDRYDKRRRWWLRGLPEDILSFMGDIKLETETACGKKKMDTIEKVHKQGWAVLAEPNPSAEEQAVDKVNSYSVVGNSRTKRELALLIYSIRRFTDKPIYIMTDDETSSYLNKFNFSNADIDATLTSSYLRKLEQGSSKVTKKNDFHHAGMILSKMDCVSHAVGAYGNTLFIDADLVFLAKPDIDIQPNIQLMLSPHYHSEERVEQNTEYGIYNAGYLWTDQPTLGDVWRDIYLNKSTFYEQQGMFHLMEHFDTSTFPKSHNIGFWRFRKPWPDGKLRLEHDENLFDGAISLHFHAFEENYARANEGLTEGYNQLKEICWRFLPEDIKAFAEGLEL